MNRKPHEIGFDFDGVVADTGEAFIRLACEQHNFCSFRLQDIHSFQIEDNLPIPRDIVERIFLDILRDSLTTGVQPMPDAVEVITAMTDNSPVSIITARSLEKPVTDWFDHFFPANTCQQIQIVAMGEHDGKLQYIQEHGLQYFVDDRLQTCLQLKGSGITPIVFSQPWNQGRHSLQTVANWQEIKNFLDKE